MRNGNTLQDTIGNLDIDNNDNITEQLSSLRNTTNQLNNNKLNKSDVTNYVPSAVNSWLNNNVNPIGSAVTVDKSLSVDGSAADAKRTGSLKTSILNLLEGKETVFYNIIYNNGFNINDGTFPFENGWDRTNYI